MQVTRPTAPLAIKKVEKSKAKTLTNEAAKTARETKLQQAMLAMIEDIPESVETTEEFAHEKLSPVYHFRSYPRKKTLPCGA